MADAPTQDEVTLDEVMPDGVTPDGVTPDVVTLPEAMADAGAPEWGAAVLPDAAVEICNKWWIALRR